MLVDALGPLGAAAAGVALQLLPGGPQAAVLLAQAAGEAGGARVRCGVWEQEQAQEAWW